MPALQVILLLFVLLTPLAAQTRRVVAIAHRGEHLHHPENTIPAFQAAIDVEADFIEVDVRTSVDGKLVLSHDATVNRCTNGQGEIAKMTFDELRALDAGIKSGPAFAGTRIPTFDEVLDLARGNIGVYVDVKQASAKDLVSHIARHGMSDHVVIYAGLRLSKEIQELNPKLRVMPESTRLEVARNLIEQLHPRVIAFSARDFTPEIISVVKQAGAEIYVDRMGVTDAPAGWQSAIDAGADGIQTDRPGELVQYLQEKHYRPSVPALRSPVQDKNFYLLSILERDADARQTLKSDGVLSKLAATKRDSLGNAVTSCNLDIDCYAGALKWTDQEIATAGQRFRDLYTPSGDVRRLTDGPLRSSGMFQRYHDRPAPELLLQAWSDAARGINNIIEVYGTGRAPRYPQIDSVTYDVKSDSYHRLIRNMAAVLQDQGPAELFFQTPLKFALMLLDANGRDEAGRLEPLETGENAAAIRRISSIRWKEFPYSAIIVPGSGADRPSIDLSPSGKLRLMLAAKRFHQGKAPIILVSGGFVHPVQTPYGEAVEMKKYLIAHLGVPADAILIDPHARHTTTNLRNAARQIYRYGIPFEKPALITTDLDQSRSIESPAFAARCMRELGYMPGQIGKRISPFDLEFLPRIDSLHADSMDPLDP